MTADRLRQLAERATPGPWRVAQRDEPIFTRRSVLMEDGEPVAMIHRWSDDVDAADARLIALAPELAVLVADLAEALRQIRSWDVMDVTADGRYWREDVIDPLLGRVERLGEPA